jgi:hypothetical protein
MATEAQIAANRRNAEHSTGPKTDAGKETSSRNAMKFGLFTRNLLLPGEDESELAALGDGIRARLRPADALEELYVERIVAASWRLQRALKGEAETLVWLRDSKSYMCRRPPGYSKTPMEQLQPLERHIASLERSIDKAVGELNKLQKARREAEEEDRNEGNEANSETVDGQARSLPIEIVKTKPISGPSDVQIRENEANSVAPPADGSHGRAVGFGGEADSSDVS